jgi:hypothetical protein
MDKLTALALLFFMVCITSVSHADNNASQFKQYSEINHNWSELSSNQYIDNLVACELKLQAHKWSMNIWPEANKAPKPAFNQVVELDKVREQVLDVLKMQSVLADRFNINITDEMLQHDLDRMAINSQDANGLKALFALFNNNPNTIAQCVSRPNLVKQKLQNVYYQNEHLHKNTKELAQSELLKFLNEGYADNLRAKATILGFEVEKENSYKLTNDLDLEQQTVQLPHHEFNKTLKQLSKNHLQEKYDRYLYTKIIHESDEYIKAQILTWNKINFKEWFKTQTAQPYQLESPLKVLTLPLITSHHGSTFKSSMTGDTWHSKYYGAPSKRVGHSAIWTGSEMIVWGGHSVSGATNTGGRYNPATDSWKFTGIYDAPTARAYHTAIWTGSEMIVWGGYEGDDAKNTGGRYNPVSDEWIMTSLDADVPSARSRHSAIWTGSEMIVWGGYDENFVLNSGGRYNPVNDSWSATDMGANLPNPKVQHTVVWTGDEMIVWGGYEGSGGGSMTGGRYNPISDSWLEIGVDANTPFSRLSHSAIWTGSEMIIWGGDNNIGYVPFNTGGRYNPTSDSWEITSIDGDVPDPRVGHTAVWTGEEMIVWGGVGSGCLSIGGRYNPSNNTWTSTNNDNNVPSCRQGHTAIWTGSEMIVWGGYEPNGFINSGGRYNPDKDEWMATETGANVDSARYNHTAIWNGYEMIVWGGRDNYDFLNTGGRYNPATDRWKFTETINAPTGRSFHTAIWEGNEMIVWGGFNGETLNSGGRYNPFTDEWKGTNIGGDVPSERGRHSAIWTGGEMIVWGGYDENDLLNTGGRYDPVNDSWTVTSLGVNLPSMRAQHTAVWTGSEMIVWGGFDGSSAGSMTGGRYDPVADSWQETGIDANTPNSRMYHTAIWTGNEMIIWGGDNQVGYTPFNTGGRYDPVNDSWERTSVDSNTPSHRAHHTAIWTGDEMVVWGGSDVGNLSSGGRYDPMTDSWLPTREDNVPCGRSLHTAIWSDHEMIVWGGNAASTCGPNLIEIYYPYNTYSVSGQVAGLAGGEVILQLNGVENISISENGSFYFDRHISEGTAYSVWVISHPESPVQTCTVSHGMGTIMGDVTDVMVTCHPGDLIFSDGFE